MIIMKIKQFILALTVVFSTSVLSYAQTEDVNTNEYKAKQEAAQLTEKLTLSSDQKEQVYYISLGINQKNEAIIADKNLTKEQQAEYLKGNEDAKKEMIKSVLTPEQRAKFENTKQTNTQLRGNQSTPIKKVDTKPQVIQLKMN
jgi:hypothetical protein